MQERTDDFDRLIETARNGAMTPEDVAELATRLAGSGERLTWSLGDQPADIASTGGPGSLSTILGALALRACGRQVVKLAVPGRPAGAIDTLATIPGYRPRFSQDEVLTVMDQCGFAHFLADATFAPLDAGFYSYRRRVGAVALPPLAVASLLAKKLAVGVRAVGLDVRVGSYGNFGVTRSAAQANSRLFCSAARVLGIDAVAFLSSNPTPAQPWLGRGESLVALASLLGHRPRGDDRGWLRSHAVRCFRMASTVAYPDAELRVECDGFRAAALSDALADHLAAQGSSLAAFIARVDVVAAQPTETIWAAEPGVFNPDLGRVRDILVDLQSDTVEGGFHDPGGLFFHAQSGDALHSGQPIAIVRSEDDQQLRWLVERLRPALRLDAQLDHPPSAPSDADGLETVRA